MGRGRCRPFTCSWIGPAISTAPRAVAASRSVRLPPLQPALPRPRHPRHGRDLPRYRSRSRCPPARGEDRLRTCHPLDAIGDHFGMLDEVGQRVDHAGDDHLVVVAAAGPSGTRYSCAWRGLANGNTKPPTFGLLRSPAALRQRDVAIVRAFVVAPAGMQPHPLARHVDQRVVDRRAPRVRRNRGTRPAAGPGR